MLLPIGDFTDYKKLFCCLNFANHRTKESVVSTANRSPVGTLKTTCDVTVSFAISSKILVTLYISGVFKGYKKAIDSFYQL